MDFGKKRSEAKLIRAKRKLAAKKFSFFLRKSPYFWGSKLCLLKKSIFIYRKSIKIYRKSINPQSIFAEANTPPFTSYACITFSASWVALCCWGSPSPRRCAPVRPPHGGAFAPSGRALTGVGACPCKRTSRLRK